MSAVQPFRNKGLAKRLPETKKDKVGGDVGTVKKQPLLLSPQSITQ